MITSMHTFLRSCLLRSLTASSEGASPCSKRKVASSSAFSRCIFSCCSRKAVACINKNKEKSEKFMRHHSKKEHYFKESKNYLVHGQFADRGKHFLGDLADAAVQLIQLVGQNLRGVSLTHGLGAQLVSQTRHLLQDELLLE